VKRKAQEEELSEEKKNGQNHGPRGRKGEDSNLGIRVMLCLVIQDVLEG